MSVSAMASERGTGERRQRPPSVTYSETMAKLRFPSRSQVLRDYLPDDSTVVSEATAHAWHDAPPMVNAREHLGDEARWLREAGPLSTDQRWALLYELRGRLYDLALDLRDMRVPAALYLPLTALAATIGADGDIDRVWDEALGVLDEFTAA
jgi:hypothetical protein